MSKYIKHNLAGDLYRGRNYSFLLSMLIMAGNLFFHLNACAENKFNIHALKIGNDLPEDIDLSIFQNGFQPPGTYWVDIYLNKKEVREANVEFVLKDGKLQPKITVRQWRDMGVKIDSFPELTNFLPETVITDIGKYIPSANVEFNFNQQRLNISIPQAALDYRVRDYVSPELWDQGLTALLVNYNYSGATNWQENRSSTQNNYLNLRSGMNWYAWRLRNNSAYSGGNHRWKNISTYLQRDIHSLKGQLTVGDGFTSSDLFDGIEFRGVQFASDENMLPDSQKGFAPIVRGIAQSNAQVTIKQNGYVIYQIYVAPGAFEISDLYPTASSGDLEIIIREADGRERRFTQASATMPTMLREGSIRYSLAMGRYRSVSNNSRKPYFSQVTLTYGLHNRLTAYGGAILSRDYQSLLLGSGVDFGSFGSFSLDTTHANTRLPSHQKHAGQAYRLRYVKDFSLTGTYLTLASYRYSTAGFYDFNEGNRIGDNSRLFEHFNKKSKLQLQVNQTLGDFGGIYVTALQQDYWQKSGYERTFNAGYNISHQGISYGLNYSYNFRPNSGGREQLFALSIHVPLDRWLKHSWANYSVSLDKNDRTSQQISLNGTALEDNNLFYSLQQSHVNKGEGGSGNIHGYYKGAYGRINAGYNYQHNGQQLNYGLSGGVALHPYGLTLSQELGETAVLVRAEGAKDIKVANNTAVATDWNGYAIVPQVSSYRKNRVALEPHSFSDDVDIDVNTQAVVPTKGALVLANFRTRMGNRVLVHLHYRGKPVPFGAKVTLENSMALGETNGAIVSSEGQVYLTALPDSGQLQVKWGSSETKACLVNYVLPEKRPQSGVYTLDSNCE
ncbi:fimbria/pilus outer membrane usher protein [Xenorhabdus hominickii]|uniref:Fimbrial assembly protein n=1 Tax=Xenorhabdus hominickii TaxID=351679 RepID=A0A2G0QB49_XENHO|nr:fimbria/pilus outer membrane usher protein [Xenorhabdus hominickii]AOM40613.1 fimbrial assembly protein [Xenorhabdus hominickii]PHM56438.1 long polar fimbrial usher protein LpfC [Xenorhabdus hominickii]